MTNSNDGILIIGGTSDIGREIGVRLCRGRQVVLAARRAPDLQPFYEAGATKVHILYFEAADLRAYRTLFQQAEQLAGGNQPGSCRVWRCWVISNGQKSTSSMRRT